VAEKGRPQPERSEDRQLEELSEAFKSTRMEEDCFAPPHPGAKRNHPAGVEWAQGRWVDEM
jgi:hypothetical protein